LIQLKEKKVYYYYYYYYYYYFKKPGGLMMKPNHRLTNSQCFKLVLASVWVASKVRKYRSEKRALALRAPYAKKHPEKAAFLPAATQREPRWYEADDAPVRLPRRGHATRPAKLRASITPGTVLILLAGRFRGKRVVFLKQLPSGLLLVTGPYKLNGVPLRRVDQTYVIATSTKVDLGNVNLENIQDQFFQRAAHEESKKDSSEFFKEDKKTKVVSAERKAEQKRVDAALIPTILKTEHLKHYLQAKFSLTNGLLPHDIKF